ncbi:MAG: serine/threonine-protein kinase [Myxococcota bacterium]
MDLRSTSECLSDALLARIVGGALPEAQRLEALAHADGCGRCHELLGNALRLAMEVDPSAATQPSTPSSSERPEPGDVIDHYTVVETLGRGGMGLVVRARDPTLERDVALKFVLRPGDERASRRMVREAQAMARLAHPNVVTVHAVGRYKSAVYVAMELIDGETLTEWQGAAPRPWTEVLRIWTRAGRGLVAAHAAGLVHRDFKPDNVLIAGDGRVLVTDFGLAAAGPASEPGSASASSDDAQQGSLTRTGARLGTPRFMAPEQFAEGPVGPAADQFAFGVSLYFALYGSYPFDGRDYDALARAVQSGDLTTLRPSADIPAALLSIVSRTLSVRPTDRYPDMETLLSVLARVASRPLRRRRLALVVGVGATALAAGGVAAWSLRPQPCAGVSDRVESVWSDARAAVIGIVSMPPAPNPRPGLRCAHVLMRTEVAGWSRQPRCARRLAWTGPNPRRFSIIACAACTAVGRPWLHSPTFSSTSPTR